MRSIDIFTVMSAARYLRVSEKRVRKLLALGLLRSTQRVPLGTHRISRKEVERVQKLGLHTRSFRKPQTKFYNKHTLESVKRLARKLGWECVSTTYVRNSVPLTFACPNGHEFTSQLGNLKRRAPCRYC